MVFIHKQNDWAEELPYALRSLKHLPHRKVWFFGHKPDWVTNVEHVPVADITPKWDDIQNKYLAFLTYQGDMTDEVVSMYDDIYFLDDRYQHQDLPSYHWGTAQQAYTGGRSRRRLLLENPETRVLSTYRQTIVDAGRILEEHGVERPLNYSLHVPFVFVRSKVPVEWYDQPKPVQWRTMGGNTSGRRSTDLQGDVKVNHRVTLAQALSRDTGFLSSLNSNFQRSGVRRLLKTLFPKPCEYERAAYGIG